MDIIRRLHARATDAAMPDGTTYKSISLGATRELARETDLTPRSVEIQALKNNIIPERYVRNFKTLSLQDQITLLQARVVLIGLGGLGGTLVELLARLGVGHIIAADGDTFEQSNLNRQLLSREDSLHHKKADLARERVRQVNDAVSFEATDAFVDRAQMDSMLQNANLAIDALGGLDVRPELRQASAEANVPLVTAAIAGWAGYVATVFPGQTGPDKLFKPGNPAEDTLGCIAPTVHVAAAMQSSEAVHVLCSRRNPEDAQQIMFFDLANQQYDLVRL